MVADHDELRPAALQLKHHTKITAYAELVEIPTQLADPKPAMSMRVAEGFTQRIAGSGYLPALVLR
ncbi:MAG: hypothetical protein PSW75_06170 [bacterium]|nr:hypothetical protein [bacterium]MDI1336749.1 hypothetical protein [Lacunisphaera sp.]